MIKHEAYESVAHHPVFQQLVRRKSRLLWVLTLLSLFYYFALLLGAACFKPLFGTLVLGHINLGWIFAISQYGFAGCVAYVYTHGMKQIDAAMQELIQSHPAASTR